MSGWLIGAACGMALVGIGFLTRRWWVLWIPVLLVAASVAFDATLGCGSGRCDGSVTVLFVIGLPPVLLLLALGIAVGRRRSRRIPAA